MAAPPPNRLRKHQNLALRLGTAIMSGTYRPGDSLGGEIEAAEALGVSRTVYREALRMLIAKGLVESRPRAGTHVTPRERWHLLDPDVLAWTYAGEPDPQAVRDLFELRAILEPAAAELAATRRSEAQLAEMTQSLARMARHGLADPVGSAADREFHRLLIAAAGNAALYSLASSVGAAVTWTTRFKQRRSATPRDPLPDHQAVLAAVRAGDAAAARRAMTDLVALALADMAMS
ncbi:MAG: FadR family transcriptional regulator [Sphingomonadales bacterium]|nr:FadR family transcriptional regulator [Sphingomonadales bacterium]